MIHFSPRKLGGAMLLMLLGFALAGCGRNGPLEAPLSATPSSEAAATPGAEASVAVNPPPASPDARSTAPPAAGPPPVPKPAAVTPVYKSFFLDPLVN